MPVFWDDGPSPSDLPRHGPQVFSVRPRGEAVVCFLGQPVGVWVHWIPDPDAKPKGRTVPCLQSECVHCPDARLRRNGYAPALLWQRVEVTEPSPALDDWPKHPDGTRFTFAEAKAAGYRPAPKPDPPPRSRGQ
ncbi:MAG TPA: hypothetical protein VEL76_06670, partial [Gemmataceae bacterium]|nr:hypothetical protein [Gemmataceae bacterium]